MKTHHLLLRALFAFFVCQNANAVPALQSSESTFFNLSVNDENHPCLDLEEKVNLNDCQDQNGCTDPEACNFDPEATTDDGSCDYPGCPVPEACNYLASSCPDYDLCEFETCQGCTYPFDLNYDPTATIEDGSCSGEIATCPPDFNNDDVVNGADLLTFLSYFGAECN